MSFKDWSANRNNRESDSYREYNALRIAATDYLNHVVYYTTFKVVNIASKYSLDLVSNLTDLIQQEQIELFRAIGYFRMFYNYTQPITALELVEQNIKSKQI